MPKTISKASSTNRAGYQKGYQLGNRGGSSAKGTGPTAAASVKSEPLAKVSSGGSGGRKKKLEGGGDFNVSYGNTLPIGDLQEVVDFGKEGKAGKALGTAKAVSYAKEKGDKGSGFNYGKRR